MKAKHALFEQFLIDGIEVIFGNPGTTEESILDASLNYPQIKYIWGLQESIVVAMADGYARAKGKAAVIQLHSIVGLGNAMAMLYQANRSHTPLVVFIGEAYSQYADLDGFLGGNAVEMVNSVVKWATRVTVANQLLRIWRRALKIAMTPPFGPVFISIPMDILDSDIVADVCPTSFIIDDCAPLPAVINEVIALIDNAENPMIFVGDGVSMSKAQAELESFSNIIGAPIFGLDFADLNASFKNPLFQGLLSHGFGDDVRKVTITSDLLIFIGTSIFPELFQSTCSYFSDTAKIIHIDQNSWEISKNYPSLGIRASPRILLKTINDDLQRRNNDKVEEWLKRKEKWIKTRSSSLIREEQAFKNNHSKNSLNPYNAMNVIIRNVEEETIVFDESITMSSALLHCLKPSIPGKYFLGRGGCIGIGWPSSIGVKIANPEHPVLSLSGDGSSLYIIQSLWTAAHYNLKIIFIVCNNRSYQILKVNLIRYWESNQIDNSKFPYMDISEPDINFKIIAEGFGLLAFSAADENALEAAMKSAYKNSGPTLIDVIIDSSQLQLPNHLNISHGFN